MGLVIESHLRINNSQTLQRPVSGNSTIPGSLSAIAAARLATCFSSDSSLKSDMKRRRIQTIDLRDAAFVCVLNPFSSIVMAIQYTTVQFVAVVGP